MQYCGPSKDLLVYVCKHGWHVGRTPAEAESQNAAAGDSQRTEGSNSNSQSDRDRNYYEINKDYLGTHND